MLLKLKGNTTLSKNVPGVGEMAVITGKTFPNIHI